METRNNRYSRSICRRSRAKLAPQEIAPQHNGILPIFIQSVYSFQIIVPVVQRKEPGFPKPSKKSPKTLRHGQKQFWHKATVQAVELCAARHLQSSQ